MSIPGPFSQTVTELPLYSKTTPESRLFAAQGYAGAQIQADILGKTIDEGRTNRALAFPGCRFRRQDELLAFRRHIDRRHEDMLWMDRSGRMPVD